LDSNCPKNVFKVDEKNGLSIPFIGFIAYPKPYALSISLNLSIPFIGFL